MMAIFHILQALGAAYIVWAALQALTRMTPSTRHMVYVAYLVMLAGALIALLSSFSNTDKFDFDCVLVVGVALYLAVNRRPADLHQLGAV